jgi:hypothetical protein
MGRKLRTALYVASVVMLAMSISPQARAQSQQYSQGTNPILDLIGMIANASAISSAKKKWAKVSPEIQQCVNTFSESKNFNVDQIIAAGLSPNHEAIAPMVTLCQAVTTAEMKTDFPCNVTNKEGKQVQTTCVQSYAKAVRGAWVPISRDDFLRAASNNETVSVADFETIVAQNARLSEERRILSEAAAKAEATRFLEATRAKAARVEQLAREEAARKAREEEQRRFAASPEGKRLIAEQAATERRAEMERQAEARAAAVPLSPAQARSMLRVWPEKEWVSVWERSVLKINVQALQSSVKITSVKVNRGSCGITPHYSLPLYLNYGQTLSTMIDGYPSCNVISAEIGTSKGTAYFRFR